MIEIYKEKGLSEADARRLIEIITSKPEYSSFFVDHMMVQELGLQVRHSWCMTYSCCCSAGGL